ncbi:MAG: acyltransferase family protein [Dysgonomonas sp.]
MIINSANGYILLLSYWTIPDLTKVFDWYIPAILVIYAAAPLFYYFYKKSKFLSSSIIIIFFYILSFLVIDTPFANLQLITMRIPMFIIGFCIADYSHNHKNAKLSLIGIFLCISGMIVGFGFLNYLFYYFPDQFSHFAMYGFALFTFPLCMFYAYFFSLFSKYKFPVLNFLGKNTLYLYIFHERILKILELNEITPYTDWIALVLTFIIAMSWSKFIDYIIFRFESPKIV